MKKTVDFFTFQLAFESIRPDNFSYEGLSALFDHIEELESDIGEEIELDVIALCCDYSEESYKDIANSYDIPLDSYSSQEEEIEAILDYLTDEGYGYIASLDSGSIVYKVF